MNSKAKQLYNKMIDFKQFATVSLAVGAFFYLGVIIPSLSKSEFDTNIMMVTTILFLTASMIFFIKSKNIRLKLSEMEEGQDLLNK